MGQYLGLVHGLTTRSVSIQRGRRNRTHPIMIPSVDTRQNRGEGPHCRRVLQGPSSEISFDGIMGVFRSALLSTVQSNAGHLCQIVHGEKFQSRICSIFNFHSTSCVSISRLWFGVLLVSEGAVKPPVALSGIPIEVADISWRGVAGSSWSSPGCSRGG